MASNRILDPEQWVTEHGDYLYRYAMSKLREDAAAQDAVQETFVAALKGAERFSGRSTERTWLIGILKHKIVDYIRKASRERPYEDTMLENASLDDFFDAKGHWKVGIEEWKVNPRKAVEQAEFWSVFESCMEKLQDRHGQAFRLRELDGLTADEICKTLNVSPTNLWVMLHRARTKLKACLTANWFKANQ